MNGKLLYSGGLGFNRAKSFSNAVGRQFARNGQKGIGGVISAKLGHLR